MPGPDPPLKLVPPSQALGHPPLLEESIDSMMARPSPNHTGAARSAFFLAEHVGPSSCGMRTRLRRAAGLESAERTLDTGLALLLAHL